MHRPRIFCWGGGGGGGGGGGRPEYMTCTHTHQYIHTCRHTHTYYIHTLMYRQAHECPCTGRRIDINVHV